MGGSVLYYYFGCSSDRRCHHSKQYWSKSCRNSNRTFLMTVKSSSRLRELTNSTAIIRIGKFYLLFSPLKYHVTICLYPIDPKARAKIAGYRAKKKPAVQPTEQCFRTMISNYQDSKIKLFNMANIP